MEGQQRMALWAAEEEIGPDEIDIQDSLALAQAQQALYAQQMFVEDGAGVPGINEATLLAMQQQLAQQAAFATIPDVVKRVSVKPDISMISIGFAGCWRFCNVVQR
jgi:translation initiation factor 3 subunit L